MDDVRPRKRRLFVGIALDDAVRAACVSASTQLQRTGFSARYESHEKLHVTLAFLGFVEPARVDDVVRTLAAAAVKSARFAVTLDKLSAFPHERKPRVVFVGAREQGARFRTLAANVRDAYAALGFEFNNDPVAHVTIARVKESKRPLPLIELAPISLRIIALTLFESLPDPANRTSRYQAVTSVRLAELDK